MDCHPTTSGSSRHSEGVLLEVSVPNRNQKLNKLLFSARFRFRPEEPADVGGICKKEKKDLKEGTRGRTRTVIQQRPNVHPPPRR
jgi:hypothetical protein